VLWGARWWSVGLSRISPQVSSSLLACPAGGVVPPRGRVDGARGGVLAVCPHASAAVQSVGGCVGVAGCSHAFVPPVSPEGYFPLACLFSRFGAFVCVFLSLARGASVRVLELALWREGGVGLANAR